MALAGVSHITVPPGLLRELASNTDTDSANSHRFLFDVGKDSVQKTAYKAFVDDESAFRMAFTRSNNGANEGKLIQVSPYPRALSGLPVSELVPALSYKREGLTSSENRQ